MRCILLDETGIKLLASDKTAIYLKTNDIDTFISNKYILDGHVLKINKEELLLSDKDIQEIDNIIEYIKGKYDIETKQLSSR